MKYLLVFLLLPLFAMAQSSYQQAERYYDNEEFQKAKPIFESYLREHPKHRKTREYLGDIAGYSEDWDTAISYYEPLVDEVPNNADYHFKYGGVLGMKALEISRIRAVSYIGDIKKHFHQAAKLDPDHIEVRWALVEFYMQLPGLLGGSERKAIKYANELHSISPVDGYLANGYIAEYSKRPKDAEKYYKKAIEVGGSAHTYEKLTNLYEKNEQPVEAMATAATSLKKHNRNSLNYQIGKIAAQYNLNAELGIDCLQTYIKNYSVRDGVPKDWAYYRLAQIYNNIGQEDVALKWINKALRDRPDFKEALQEKQQILSK